MRVLAVENYGGTGLGQLGEALLEAKASIDYIRPHSTGELPDTGREYDAMVVLGGGQNALDDSGSPHFPKLLDMIREFESDNKAVLGICLGSQLIARAFGGDNKIGGHNEFGWQDVSVTDAAAADPVFHVLPEIFPIFQWHDDSFTLPPQATLLATGAKVANQAYRVGRAVYATQFHFEADRKLVSQWNETFADAVNRLDPDWLAKYPGLASEKGPRADAAGAALARAWIATI
ncbi:MULTISPECIES: type 1 glutamine amidotransferase [Mesorhizobium]|uniref:GMP synthase n=1 Tax=Mesorhizobium denitrificans TaxID=2294114 RepID=A0A371XD67_9HYPH|nr:MULTISPECIES: type 1 glutamine amidotransferase [Mesorhizobium]RFC67179.1 GMP synthase [Mesorhizobium denitrificans]